MDQTPTLAQLIKQAIENRLLDVHTALIAKVESYDAEKQLANVSPVLKRRVRGMDGGWVGEQLPVLCDVPVLFPRAGGFFISFPIQPGDFVQLVFNEVDIEEWLDETTPTIAHSQRFTTQGAVAIPGIFSQSKTLTGAHKTNFVAGKDGGLQIHIDGDKIRLGSEKADEALAIASRVEAELQKIIGAFNGHIHTGTCTTGAVTTLVTTSQLGPASDMATKNVVAE
jgi:hypothetical protein